MVLLTVSWAMKGIKMYYEYCNYNTSDVLDIREEMKKVFSMIDRGLNGFCTDIFQIRQISSYIPEGFVIAGPVDYPLGKSDRQVRQHETLSLIKAGANAIDLVCHRHYLMNSDWIPLKLDIESIKQICVDHNVTLRIMLNWHDDKDGNIVVNIVKLLQEYGIDIFLPSLGYYNDDFIDNLIMTHVVQVETGVPSICNGYLHLDKHLGQLSKANVFGLRLYYSNYKMVYN